MVKFFFQFSSLISVAIPPSFKKKQPNSGMLSEFTKWLRIWRSIKNAQYLLVYEIRRFSIVFQRFSENSSYRIS